MKRDLLRASRRAACIIGGWLLLFLLADWAWPLPPHKPYSRLVLARDSSILHATLSPDDKWRMHTTLDEVPPELPAALVAKEDRWFWKHPGVNPLAIGRALIGNAGAGERISGASTITMQVARMLEPKPRTLWGKAKEMFRALQLEWHHSKQEIMEMYLSYLPYGGNVEGVEAASLLYFQRPPRSLSMGQVIMLTVIPNRPNSLRPDRNPEALSAARDKWAGRFSREGIFSPADLADARYEPLSRSRGSIPALVPQLSHHLLAQTADEHIHSTIDPKVQATASRLLGHHVERVRHQGITNGAVLVADRSSLEVLAYCASADFGDKAALGEVDAIRALRSPGSTLKPFLYAHAFDLGLATPKSIVLDLPYESAGYAPLNYDRHCSGLVSVEHALRHSLNLPAVRLLDSVGLDAFADGLARAGFRHVPKQRKEFGLSLVLGGCGVRLEELVQAYAGLANGGMVRPLRYLEGMPEEEGRRILSPEAAYLCTEILSGLERPDLPQGVLERSNLPRVAWKTGTSFGRRDAWAIGYTPRHVIGVWMGNMDGQAVTTLSGAATATPLLISLFNSLETGLPKRWFTAPEGVERRLVCPESGMLPGPDCPHRTEDLRIRGRSRMRTCTHLTRLHTDAEAHMRYCPACMPAAGAVARLYPDLHPELLGWMQRTGRSLPLPPPHNPACPVVAHGNAPRITSPKSDGAYYVERGQSIVLEASTGPKVSRLFWYANGTFIGATAAAGSIAYQPEDGPVRIACMDDLGMQSTVDVSVKVY